MAKKSYFTEKINIFKLLVMATAVLVVAVFVFFSQKEHKYSKTYLQGTALEGSGSKDDPYRLMNLEDYLEFTNGMLLLDNPFYNACFSLECDLDVTGLEDKAVIGALGAPEPFAGRFEGNGHTIRGLSYSNPEGDAGLFPELRGIVRNLRVEDASFEGPNAGGIAGQVTQKGRIYNCYVSASVGGENPGGICSRIIGRAENCYYDGTISVNALKTGSGACLNCYNLNSEVSEKEQVAELLNNNFSNMIPEGAWYQWRLTDNGDLAFEAVPVQMPMRIDVEAGYGTDKKNIGALFSENNRTFCFCIPKNLKQDSYAVTAWLSDKSSVKSEVSADTSANAAISGNNVIIDGREFAVSFYFVEDMPSVFFEAYHGNSLDYVDLSTKNNISGELKVYEPSGEISCDQKRVMLSGHGHDSFMADKKSYAIKLDRETSVAGMEAAKEFNLLAGYRNDCLFSYIYTRDLYHEMKLPFAHEYRLVNLYVDGQYRGVYFLTEKIGISKSAFDLSDIRMKTSEENAKELSEYGMITEEGSGAAARLAYYNIPHTPLDITGGYIIEMDNTTIPLDKARFITDNENVISCKSDRYLTRKQVIYIKEKWEAFEEAVYSEDGYNSEGHHFSEYIDMESFAEQWLFYELTLEKSTMDSVYFYKDSDLCGDDKLHAVFDWDVEHAFTSQVAADDLWLVKDGGNRFWDKIYAHSEFKEALSKEWKEHMRPAVMKSLECKNRSNEFATADNPSDNGIGSFDFYEGDFYTESLECNDFCWAQKGFIEKSRNVREVLLRRIVAMDKNFE